MRNIVIASHHRLAEGMAQTLAFVSGFSDARVLAAYVDDSETDPSERIARIMGELDPADETFVFTDMLGGSVTQRFFPYQGEHVHLICGINLPLVLEIALAGPDPLERDEIARIVEGARQAIIYVNDYEADSLDEDE